MSSTPVSSRAFGHGRLTGTDVLTLLDDDTIPTEPESSSSDSDDPVYDLSDPDDQLGASDNGDEPSDEPSVGRPYDRSSLQEAPV